MALTIDTSALPLISVPQFSSLTAGALFRKFDGVVLQKLDGSTAWDFAARVTVSIPSGEYIQECAGTLSITAPV